ncbi:isoleucine--tRNA ligase [Candidatus Babeliales bacterium]|nr:isoleucine--tRNA ligase [Candidatus Babeliales bacterium]
MSEENKNKNPFQETLNLPCTEFSIRANAHETEPEIISRWKKDDIYSKTMSLHENGKKFIFHDGPPYSNGHIHLGTAFNKILKDIVGKSKRMAGFHVPITPGWDCHGLPIELKVTTELGLEDKKETIDRKTFKKLCRDYASKWIDVQREEFKNLGVMFDWDNPYTTMQTPYEASILESLATFVEKGFIERKGKTVPWCASCQTVLATAEIEYKDKKDPSCYVLFPLADELARKTFPFAFEQNPTLKTIGFLAWTTTPWTIPLNRALVLHPTATYAVLAGPDNVGFIVAKELASKVCKELGIEQKELAEFDPVIFKGKTANSPLIDHQKSKIVLDDSVLLGDGTACVHSAPGCGPEDYVVGIKNGLEIFSPLSANGSYTNEVVPSSLAGMLITDGQWAVLKMLKERGTLLHKGSLNHSFPHCWRCRNPLMFRATDQWFCNLQQHDLVKKTVEEINEGITFVPAWGKERLLNFVQNRAEWCISRQRQWGVPITALLCNGCDTAFVDGDFIRKIAQKVAEHGVEYWDNVTIHDLKRDGILPAAFACKSCGNADLEKFRQERDILDVWFDSGVSHYAVLEKNKKLGFPADLYLEGSDQHRGWFQSSLLSSMVINSATCTKTFLTHGYVVDKNRHKMSKSVGNVVAPDDVIKQYSRDILRLWVGATDFSGDIVMSDTLLKNIAEVYRKIRNTCRFMISNLYDFDMSKDALALNKLCKIDQYILTRLYELEKQIRACYESYDLTGVVRALSNFCTNDLSSMYLDIVKDRLYVEQADGRLRRSCQTAVYYILNTLTHLMAPIMSFLAEEVSDYYQKDKKASIHLNTFVSLKEIEKINTDAKLWKLLEEIRDVVLKALEEKRQAGTIKHSLEARLELYFEADADQVHELKQFIEELARTEDANRFLKDWFIVSQVKFVPSSTGLEQSTLPWVYLKADHALGIKCQRCWQWDDAPAVQDEPLCVRCKELLNK